MENRTGQLYFIGGKFFERIGIGNGDYIWDEELQDITEEVVSAIRNKLGDMEKST